MKNSTFYYNKVLKNLKKKTIFYSYFKNSYSYTDLNLYFWYYYRYFKKHNIKNKNIYIFPDKSFEMYGIILAILLTENIFVPVNSKINNSGLKEMFDQCKPDFFFYGAKSKKKIKKFFFKNIKIICLKKYNKKQFKYKNNKKVNLNKIDFNQIGMIYFTSGSTGNPKGIRISHENICSDIIDQNFHLFKSKKKLNFGDYHETSFSIFFDIFFPAIFLSASISPAINTYDILFPEKHILKNSVNCLVTVPSTIQRIKENNNNKTIKLKILIITGEPFYLPLLKYIFKKFNTKFIFNCYGGTEMSNWVFFHKCQKSDLINYKQFGLVPIGNKFRSTKYRILNKRLFVKGPMISKGYTIKSLNKGKFNFKKQEFNTGDHVTLYKKKLICLGRSDRQIKIRGYRIELGEVESKILQFNFINEAVVFEQKERNYRNYIACALSLNKKINIENIKKKFQSTLRDYMIPKKIFLYKKMPRNKNGKIDRKYLIKNLIT